VWLGRPLYSHPRATLRAWLPCPIFIMVVGKWRGFRQSSCKWESKSGVAREINFFFPCLCVSRGRRRPTVSFKMALFWFFFKVNSAIKQRCFGQNALFYLKERQNVNFSNQSLYLCAFFSLVLSFGFSQSSF
jgi:hypothetical protein